MQGLWGHEHMPAQLHPERVLYRELDAAREARPFARTGATRDCYRLHVCKGASQFTRELLVLKCYKESKAAAEMAKAKDDIDAFVLAEAG